LAEYLQNPTLDTLTSVMQRAANRFELADLIRQAQQAGAVPATPPMLDWVAPQLPEPPLASIGF
jgi:hypothetical protein